MSTCNILDLPIEVLAKILSHVPISTCETVCRKFYQASCLGHENHVNILISPHRSLDENLDSMLTTMRRVKTFALSGHLLRYFFPKVLEVLDKFSESIQTFRFSNYHMTVDEFETVLGYLKNVKKLHLTEITTATPTSGTATPSVNKEVKLQNLKEIEIELSSDFINLLTDKISINSLPKLMFTKLDFTPDTATMTSLKNLLSCQRNIKVLTLDITIRGSVKTKIPEHFFDDLRLNSLTIKLHRYGMETNQREVDDFIEAMQFHKLFIEQTELKVLETNVCLSTETLLVMAEVTSKLEKLVIEKWPESYQLLNNIGSLKLLSISMQYPDYVSICDVLTKLGVNAIQRLRIESRLYPCRLKILIPNTNLKELLILIPGRSRKCTKCFCAEHLVIICPNLEKLCLSLNDWNIHDVTAVLSGLKKLEYLVLKPFSSSCFSLPESINIKHLVGDLKFIAIWKKYVAETTIEQYRIDFPDRIVNHKRSYIIIATDSAGYENGLEFLTYLT